VAQGEPTQLPLSAPVVATVRVTVTAPAGCASKTAPKVPTPMLPMVAVIAMTSRRRCLPLRERLQTGKPLKFWMLIMTANPYR